MNTLDLHVLSRARRLRSNPTPAEKRLWWALRARNFSGLKWRRQSPWGPYVLDFFCKDARIAIEVDGDSHAEPDQMRDDQARRVNLERAGIKLLRVSNAEVMADVGAVLERIIRVAEQPAP
ncbi:MAG: endonuclease domain-containing protein [Myxococcaceae bacterium]